MRWRNSRRSSVNSSLYHGRVSHCRHHPRKHAFNYRLFQFYLDLDELSGVLDRLWFCSSRRPAPIRFRRNDHVGPPEVELKTAVQRTVLALGGPKVDGRICLLTNLRYFGYGFNPVSFYFCFDPDDQLVAVLAEVNNTPWGEQHCYLVPRADDGAAPALQKKEFHVSPFMDLDMHYRWRVSEPGRHLTIHIENVQHGARLFDASLALAREPLTGLNLARMMAGFPLMTLKVTGAIYFEALRLWLKKIPFHSHSKSKEAPLAATEQT
ncbi:MAG: DUF1365 domain-containing protein [Gammaproteobacteria bacterium]|nr:DUF1365 domain-containing protein [Gammaproteobacteria bacterium]